MGWNWLCAIFIVSSMPPYSDSACTFPSILSGSWWDSNRGVLTFGSENINGLSFTIYGTNLQNWDCWQVDGFQGQNDGGTLIIKAEDFLSAFGVNFYVYLCLNLTRISAYSFYYYQMYDRQTNANNERVFVTDAPEDSLTKDDICKKQLDSGFDAEFKLLLKKGSEYGARQELPDQLLGNFEYILIDTNGSYCSSLGGQMETCNDKKTMVFDYTKCKKEIAYSTSGNLSCVAKLQKGSHMYVMMYNPDPAEPIYRFTCFVVSMDGTRASYVYKNCSSNQSPDTFSLASDGSPIGGKLSLKINATCYNSYYETVWTTRSPTTMSGSVHDTTNVTVQPLPHDTTNVTVQSLPPKVTQIPLPTDRPSSPTTQNADTIKHSDSQENANKGTVSAEGGISTGAIVAIGVTIGILSAVIITVVIIYLVIKRRPPSIKRKVLSFMNISK
ncbi:hypothetical protein CHS0354_026263 [Potamilus streckersoni]|uniref:DUF7042 domain-containing protein n=1 Tax=Potamilus streckersoni TaxID=2493646 RepID=A0AAE0T682_9BIVA|nr:hypothetical protein CHS0354_026263 [Potamilus streckersoni]